MHTSSGLTGKVVVITGASSGLGRAAALELARKRAHVVIAARNLANLEDTARLCREAGGEVTALQVDVTNEADVARLVAAAQELTGGIDVWVNNAGVTAFGTLESTPLEDHRRVLETNLWGAIYCARAVVPVFRRQGHGVMINVGSILSKVGQPFVPSYVISKFALRGLSEALRAELVDEPRIHVCTLLPYAIDTPHFQVGRTWSGAGRTRCRRFNLRSTWRASWWRWRSDPGARCTCRRSRRSGWGCTPCSRAWSRA